MALNLFGLEIKRIEKAQEISAPLSPPRNDDGAQDTASSLGSLYYGVYLDTSGSVQSEFNAIQTYRQISQYPEIDIAIQDIVNEAIPHENASKQVQISFEEDAEYSDELKETISEEFDTVLKLLNYNEISSDIFRQWYVDSRIAFQVLVDKADLSRGIVELRPLEALKLRKVREIQKQKTALGIDSIAKVEEYFLYNEAGFALSGKGGNSVGQTNNNQSVQTGVKLNTDSVLYTPSGIFDTNGTTVIGYLNKCLAKGTRIRTSNGWKQIEDLNIGDELYYFDTKNNKVGLTKVSEKWNNGTKSTVIIRTLHSSINCTADHPIYVFDNKSKISEYINAENLDATKHQVYLPINETTDGETIDFPASKREIVSSVVNSTEWINFDYKGKKKTIFEVADKIGINKHRLYTFVYGNMPINSIMAEKASELLKEISGFELKLESRLFGNYVYGTNLPNNVDVDFAKLFGFLIGDGWINDRKDGKRIGFSEGVYPELNEEYSSLIIKYFENCKRVVSKNRKSQYMSYFCNNVHAVELLQNMGFISGAKTKRIPEWVFRASNEIKISFIQGLMDADGSEVDTNNETWSYVIGLANELLIKDIKELWTSIGFCSGKITKVIQKAGLTILDSKPIGETIAWRLYLSKKKLPNTENIIEIKRADDIEVYDIEVENEEHNFIANGIVVHNCIRPINQLRMMEDAMVVQRIARAPERRIFYIDVGSLPKAKAEQYVKDIMNQYRNKIVYNGETGQLSADKKYMSTLEDFFIPQRESKGTKIETLPGMQNNGIEDTQYFKERVYEALNIPKSRLQPETGFSIGRSTEVTRDEVKFQKFIDRLRRKFSRIFYDSLKTQLILKGICNNLEWEEIRQNLYFEFQKDNAFSELKDIEVLTSKLGLLQQADQYLGKYFSKEYVNRHILHFNDEELERMQEQIEMEKGDPTAQPTIPGMPPGMDPSMMGGDPNAQGGQFDDPNAPPDFDPNNPQSQPTQGQ